MKKLLYQNIRQLFYLSFFLIAIQFTSCKKDQAPVITGVRYYVESPGDSIVNNLSKMGKYIVIEGSNLSNLVMVTFDGIPASVNQSLVSDKYAVVSMPEIPFNKVSKEKKNVIQYTTTEGTTLYTINIEVPPSIVGLSTEMPVPGDTVTITGTGLYGITELNFAGVKIEKLSVDDYGKSISFVCPVLPAEGGSVTISTDRGSFTTPYKIGDISTGLICDFDTKNPVGWGGGGAIVTDNNVSFPKHWGKYGLMKHDAIAPWDWQAWNSGRIIILDGLQWLPTENLDDKLESWAVKFEINVPEPWNGFYLYVSAEHDNYKAIFAPWLKADNSTVDVKTKGWITVTVPFSAFTNSWELGKGTAPTSIKQLLGDTGKSSFAIQTMNVGSKTSKTGFLAAIDNIRIVKIK